ncbi:MAG TPA: hypothetical protein VMH22_10900 [bacterium]|nr:hypothetical protein [bacterium]
MLSDLVGVPKETQPRVEAGLWVLTEEVQRVVVRLYPNRLFQVYVHISKATDTRIRIRMRVVWVPSICGAGARHYTSMSDYSSIIISMPSSIYTDSVFSPRNMWNVFSKGHDWIRHEEHPSDDLV